MKVLVTGGCGFIGSHTCEFYIKRGDKVVSYDNMTKYELEKTGYATESARNYNWDLLANMGVEMVKGDIRNYEQLAESTKDCDFIVHTAAQPAVTLSIQDPDLDFSTNVQGTFNILKAAKEFSIPVVYCCTIHVYGNRINESLYQGETRYLRQPAEIDETHPVMEGILTPLHASKYSAEMYLRTFIDTYGIEAASFRLTGLYGPRQFGGEDHGWVANFSIRSVLGWPMHIYGTGKQVRDILYASDVVRAFHAFYERRKTGIYNIGGGKENAISLIECIELIGDITGKKPSVLYKESRLGDLQYFISDISKAQRQLDWEPKVRPKEGVRNLLDWINESREVFGK